MKFGKIKFSPSLLDGESENGVWAIQLRRSLASGWLTNENTGHGQSFIYYGDREPVAYDRPEVVPQYVNDAIQQIVEYMDQ